MLLRKKDSFGALSVRLLGAILFLTLTFPLYSAEQTYVVKRGDTLYGISRHFGVSVAQLTDRNGLARSEHIYAGQRLIVPGKGGASTETSALPSAIRKAIAAAPVKPGRWKYIVIHHSGVDTGTMAGMDRYHREVRHMEHGLAYHFVIGNGSGMKNGEIEPSSRWTEQENGGHLASEAQNKIAIGICLVGNFEAHKPTAAQLKSLNALVQALLDRCHLPVSAVKMHREINIVGTRCPGKLFPEKEFLSQLKKERS